jgi:DNA-binding XRE family transcriptional regulator
MESAGSRRAGLTIGSYRPDGQAASTRSFGLLRPAKAWSHDRVSGEDQMQPYELKELRRRKGWSQTDLARRLDISKSRLQDFERGRTAGAQSKPAPIPVMMELACSWLATQAGDIYRITSGQFAARAAVQAHRDAARYHDPSPSPVAAPQPAPQLTKTASPVLLDTSPPGGPVPPELAELREEPSALRFAPRLIAQRAMAELEFDEALAVIVDWHANLPPVAQVAVRVALCG